MVRNSKAAARRISVDQKKLHRRVTSTKYAEKLITQLEDLRQTTILSTQETLKVRGLVMRWWEN